MKCLSANNSCVLNLPLFVPQVSFCRILLFPVDEEGLRKRITEELCKDLEKDRAKAEEELQAWLDAHKDTHKHTSALTICLVFKR